ncbi:MAG: phospho-N-acetylmuramoyl-pentapeptide-transferase [Clostridia bacterium]|nr:phospho-N-acetylmuramoyl-pentapeptide-transferase [Clostridia bacterium]
MAMKTHVLSALCAFLVSLLFCYLLIPLLRRLKAGQNILVYVKEHKQKSGTPTMGGLAFIAAATLVAVLFVRKAERTFVVTLAIGLAYMAVGLIDDSLKRKHKENLGLKAWQKFTFQTCIAVLAGTYCFRAGLTDLHVPFFGSTLKLGFWALPLTVFVFLATVNAVNLTDGLDGLAAGVSAPFFLTLGIIISLQTGAIAVPTLCFCLTGALLAYLLFNSPPASVFMGDTGSLALGGFAACAGVFTGNALYILVIGLPFVFSVISVIVQVIYYKATGGKRIFLMSPVHHHFQQKGYSESKISYGYSVLTLALGVACIVAIL